MSNETPKFIIGNGPDGSAALLVTQPPEHTARLVIEKSELYDDVWETVVSAVMATQKTSDPTLEIS